MALNNQYLILDSNLKRIGTLTVDGATKFSNDSVKIQLADSDTTSTNYDDDVNVGTNDTFNGTINLNAQSKKFDHQGSLDVLQGQPDSDKVVAGNNLAYYDELSGHWYVMRIYSAEENNSAAVKHVTTANFTNLCLYSLAHHYPIATTASASTIQTAFNECFNATGWVLDYQTTNVMTPTITIDGKTKASTLLQTLIQTYDVEIDPYVKIDSQGNIKKKVCVITDKLNADVVYNEAVFGNNMTSIKRTTVSTPVTKLIPYGANGSTIAVVNDGKPYIVDDEANQKYNPDWQAGLYYEAIVTANQISNSAGLKSWAKDMLKLYNHPRTYYEVNVTPNFNPPLGATIRFKDELIEPVLDASGRVIQRTISFANPYGNTVGFGEYTTVKVATPAWMEQYQNALSKAVEEAKKDASSIKPVALTPDGNNFTDTHQTKRLILQAWEGSTNISSYIDSKGFIWRRYNTDGTVDTSYQQTGYLINAASNAVGTLHGTIESDYIQDDPEIKLDTTEISYLGVYGPDDNGAHSATQYMARLSNGQYLTSRARDDGGSGDTMFALQDNKFAVQSVMLQIHGQHGGTFGVQEANSTIYIWNIVSLKNDGNYILVRFPYVAGVTLQPTDKRVQQIMPLKGYGRINYDRQHDMVSIGYSDGSTDILKASDLLAGNYNVLYNFNITDYGIDFNKNTYQSECLDFPYFYFASGGGEAETTNDPHKVWALNVVHKGSEFEAYFDNDMVLPNLTDESREVETCNVFYQGTQAYLLVTFNTRVLEIDPYSAEKEKVYTIPITKRPVASVIDKGIINENDNTGD
ncbi:phage tail spike protein [Lactiplantibacillus plantarum]|uniref:phage tail spike protein n=1 Tax=Lactiplantibacillus plantarum TaxID=1590 RepID=UPI00338E54DD